MPTHFFPRRRTESYPLHLALNFQQLPQESLSQYYSHFHLRSRPDATEGELASAASAVVTLHLLDREVKHSLYSSYCYVAYCDMSVIAIQ